MVSSINIKLIFNRKPSESKNKINLIKKKNPIYGVKRNQGFVIETYRNKKIV
jgi:hypothetical protein